MNADDLHTLARLAVAAMTMPALKEAMRQRLGWRPTSQQIKAALAELDRQDGKQ